MRFISLLLIGMLACPFNVFAVDEDLEEFAKEQREMLQKDTIDVQEFIGEPWYVRHKGKIIGGAIGAGVVVVGFMTFGAGAAPAAAAGAAATSHFVGTGVALSSLGVAAGAGGGGTVGSFFDNDGNLLIPEYKRAAVREFYDDNYRSWMAQSSTKKEFGERALKEIVQFLQR